MLEPWMSYLVVSCGFVQSAFAFYLMSLEKWVLSLSVSVIELLSWKGVKKTVLVVKWYV